MRPQVVERREPERLVAVDDTRANAVEVGHQRRVDTVAVGDADAGGDRRERRHHEHRAVAVLVSAAEKAVPLPAIDVDGGVDVATDVPLRRRFGRLVTVADHRPVGEPVGVANRSGPRPVEAAVVVAGDGDCPDADRPDCAGERPQGRDVRRSWSLESVEQVASEHHRLRIGRLDRGEQALAEVGPFVHKEADASRSRPPDVEVRNDQRRCAREMDCAAVEAEFRHADATDTGGKIPDGSNGPQSAVVGPTVANRGCTGNDALPVSPRAPGRWCRPHGAA